MTVFVIMGNDFPDAVFMDGVKANEYCVEKTRQNLDAVAKGESGRIYWRSYEFKVKQ